MTETEAINKANQHIQQRGGSLSNYRTPTARFVSGEWLVLYEENVRQVGAHAIVAVNDATGATQSSAGT